MIPKTSLFLVGFLALGSFSNEGLRLSRQQVAGIDSCLADLHLAGKSSDSATRARIEASVRAIRAQLVPAAPKVFPSLNGMDSARFQKLRRQVESSFPYREQRKLLRLATLDSRFTVAQVDQLLRLVSFSTDIADAANLLLPRIVDLENVADLRDVLWTTEGAKALDNFLDGLATQASEPPETSRRRSRAHTH